MQEINATITKNFTENIAYIEQYHPKLFTKLSEFDTAVTNGHYQERYELIFENGNFDVFEHSTQQYLYNKQLTKHTELSLLSANNQLDNNIFECFIRTDYTLRDVQNYKKETSLQTHHTFVSELIFLTEQYSKDMDSTIVEKYIFFGTGLGSHILPIVEKLSPKKILLIEDDLELFRLSLFVTNYASLANKVTITFAIFETEEEFSRTSELFLKTDYYLNHYIKYFQLLSHSNEKYNNFYLTLTNQPHLRFLFHDLATTYIKPLHRLTQNYNIVYNTINLSNQIKKPFLLLCSGPSLQKNIQWVQKNQDYFNIVAVSSALSYLQKNKINIDIITHIDPFDASTNSFTRVPELNLLQNKLKLFSISSPDKILELFNKKNLFLFEVGTSYLKNSLKISSPCVGSWSLLMLLALQVKDIYLLGLDLSVEKEKGKNHIDDHQDKETLNIRKVSSNENNNLTYKGSLIKTKGNFEAEIYTTPHFHGSIDIINRYFLKIQKDFQNIYNLSDGAHLAVAKPTHPEEIDTLQYNKNESNILEKILSFNSKQTIEENDLKNLNDKLLHTKKLQTELNASVFSPTQNHALYMSTIINILASQEDVFKYELSRILDDYMQYVSHYVYYAFSITTDSAKLQKIDSIFRENILKLINLYAEPLQNLLHKEYNHARN